MSYTIPEKHYGYISSLYDIQNLADDAGRQYPQLAHLLPSDAQIYDIDLNSRKVNVPKILSVQYDHNAEIIYFRVPRYYQNMDLANTVCVVQYVNANKDAGLYWVPWYDTSHYLRDPEDPEIETPTMLVPWAIGGLATAKPGIITFNVRFYRIDGDGHTFLYNMTTRPASGEILHGMQFTEEDYEQFKLDSSVVQQIYYNLDMAMENAITYWEDVQ